MAKGAKRPKQQKTVPSQPAVTTASPPALPLNQEKTQLDNLLQGIEAERGSRIVCYWTTAVARISTGVLVPLYDQLEAIGDQERIDLYLFSGGGDTDAPWPIVSLLREYCRHLGVLVPHIAKSAGTLLALGANEIVMTPLAALGPIDPTRSHPLLPKREGAEEAEPISVQDMRHAMQFIRDATGEGGAYSPEAMAQIFTALFDKIHPLAIGAIEQSYALAKLIASKCLATHMDSKADEAMIRTITDTLCDAFKAHTYSINRNEARELGLKAVNASPSLQRLMMELWKLYWQRPLSASPARAGAPHAMRIAWLDSTLTKFHAWGEYQVEQDGRLTHKSDAWRLY